MTKPTTQEARHSTIKRCHGPTNMMGLSACKSNTFIEVKCQWLLCLTGGPCIFVGKTNISISTYYQQINPKYINIDMYSMSLLAYIDKDLRADAWCEFSCVRIVFSRSVYTSFIVYLVDSATIPVQEHHCRMPSTAVEICHASLRMLDLAESSCIFLPFCVG